MLAVWRLSLPALASNFEKDYEQGDAQAQWIAVLLTKYNTLARMYMLSVCIAYCGDAATTSKGQGH